ncbi:MAG: hypothetical protein A4E30_01130 [Methanomassiliicoccales archaeon PtaB.Bin215]|nr:MAG: hypothetical protein A4E30_01130 [Methanomassiliicoccales archaeon PtaB.Bin215]
MRHIFQPVMVPVSKVTKLTRRSQRGTVGLLTIRANMTKTAMPAIPPEMMSALLRTSSP